MADALGSVRGALNASLTPLESRQYSPYGEPSQLSGSSQSTYGFTGEPTDGNGLINLRARYMNPALGQFLSLDKVELGNRYSYVGGDPVNRVDPSGMFGYSPYLTPGGTGGGWKPKPVTPAKPTPTQTQQTPGTPPTQPSHWIGGAPPLGYQPDGSLINIPSEQLQAYNPLRTLGNILAPIAQLWINLFVDSSWSQFIRDVAERPKDTLIGGYIEGLAGSYSVGGGCWWRSGNCLQFQNLRTFRLYLYRTWHCKCLWYLSRSILHRTR